MRPILCDVSRLCYRRLNGRLPTGIDRVSLEYVRHYADQARAVLGIGPFFSVLSSAESGRAFRALLGAPARARGEMAGLIARADLRWWTLPEVAGSIVLNTSHTGMENTGYASSLERRGAQPVFFVHDLIPITHPQYCRPGEHGRHLTRMRTALTTARGIITPSRHTLETLQRFCREARLPTPPMVVAPLASSLPRLDAGPRPLSGPYFVVVGTIEPRKNLVLLFELWRGLIRDAGDAAPRLVVIGQRGWQCVEEVRHLESTELRTHVIEQGACSDGELITYLRHAQALLFPSFEEGYGLPLAEALALGVPAIVSDLPTFSEIAGDIPEYAAPNDAQRWAALLREYADPESNARREQLGRIERFRPTTWPQHFGIVDGFLEKLADGRTDASTSRPGFEHRLHGSRPQNDARVATAGPLQVIMQALHLEHEALRLDNPEAGVRDRLAAMLRATADRKLAEASRPGMTSGQALNALCACLRMGDPAAAGSENADQAPADYHRDLAAAQLQLKRRNLDEASRLYTRLLLSGHLRGPVVAGLAEIARLRFDFATATKMLAILNRYEPHWQGGQGHFLQGRAEVFAGNAAAGLECLAVAARLNLQHAQNAASAFALMQGLRRAFGDLPYADALLAAGDAEGTPLARAWAMIATNRAPEAERVLLGHPPAPAEKLKHSLALSSAYTAQGKLVEAKRLAVALLPEDQAAPLYAEALRVAVLSGDHRWGSELLAAATAREIAVPEEYRRKVLLAAGDIRGGFDSFRRNAWAEILEPYCGARYASSLGRCESLADGGRAVIVAFGGPGDEIRFASFYPEIRRRCRAERVTFTCEPRLATLLRRSFPGLEFLPVDRGLHGLARHDDLRTFNRLPGFDLHALLDNAGWELAQGADCVLPVSDAMADVVEGYASFKGTSYLVADPGQRGHWRARLRERLDGPLVGLSWRGSLPNYARNEHYYSVSELAPLFEQTDLRYVCLQYDDCAEDLAWLAARYPGRMVNFPELDQYNDLDGVAALMSCLDLIITPPTTVSDLAGALGRPTWMMSNSAEHAWRIQPDGATDVWLGSVVHVSADRPGEKRALLASLADRLRRGFHPANEVRTAGHR